MEKSSSAICLLYSDAVKGDLSPTWPRKYQEENEEVACENTRSSALFTAGDVSATQRQKFHTDDVNHCLLNKSGSHGVPNANLFNCTFFLVDFGKMLCSSAKELQQNSNACSREDYIPQILIVLLEILRI